MTFPFDPALPPMSSKPDRATATMADWQNWIAGLSRYERDQLYPGMHKDLIPAYEMIEAQEERKVARFGPFVQNEAPNFDKSFNDVPGLSQPGRPDPGPDPEPNYDIGSASWFDRKFAKHDPVPTSTPQTSITRSAISSPTPAALPLSVSPLSGSALRASSLFAPSVFEPPKPAAPGAPLTPGAPGATAMPTLFGATPVQKALSAPLPVSPLTTGLSPLSAAPLTAGWAAGLFQPLSRLPAPAHPLAVTPPPGPAYRPVGLLDISHVAQPDPTGMEKTERYGVKTLSATAPTLSGSTLSSSTGNNIPTVATSPFATGADPYSPGIAGASATGPSGLNPSAHNTSTGNTSTGNTGAQNTEYGRLGDAWSRFTRIVEDAWEITSEGYQFADEFVRYYMDAPQDEQLAFLTDLGLVLVSMTGVGDTALQVKQMIDNPASRTAFNISALILGLLPLFRALKGGKKLTAFIRRSVARFKAAKGRKGAQGGRPVDVPRQAASDRQMRAGGDEHRGTSNGSAAEVKSRFTKPIEFIVDSSIATFWELLEQHFGGNNNAIRAGVQGVSGGLSEFLDNPDDTLTRSLMKEISLVFSTQLLSLLTEDNGLDLNDDWTTVAFATTEAGLIGISTGLVRKSLDRSARNKPALRRVVSYFKQPIAVAIELAVSSVFRMLTDQPERSGVENTKSLISLTPGRR